MITSIRKSSHNLKIKINNRQIIITCYECGDSVVLSEVNNYRCFCSGIKIINSTITITCSEFESFKIKSVTIDKLRKLTYDYVFNKNSLIKKYTGISLIHPKYITGIANVNLLSMQTDGLNCPYCHVFFCNKCRNCPVSNYSNICYKRDSNYHNILNKAQYESLVSTRNPFFRQLCNLVKMYNTELTSIFRECRNED